MSSYTSYAHFTSELTLRAATDHDLEDLALIWYEGWLDAHRAHSSEALVAHRRPEDFSSRMSSRIANATVAVAGSRIVGFVIVHDDEVEQIYVAASARGGGAATALLQHGEREIAARFESAWLAVIAENPRARRFYERSGWSDGGAFDYDAEAGQGTIPVSCRRYEKRFTRSEE